LLVRNKWNKRLYKIVSTSASEVTLQRDDGSQFTISNTDFYFNYVKENA
jgi:hypothetical protein